MRRNSSFLFLTTIVAIGLIAGAASAQQKGRGGRGGGGGFGPVSALTVASSEAVQKELGLSGDVVGKINTLRDDYRAAQVKEYQTANINLQDFQNLTAEQRQKMIDISTKLNAEFNPKVKELIAADPYKRLQQIQLQYNVRNSGPSALTAADVAAELKLTDEQKQKLNELNTEFGRRQRELFTGGGGGGGGEAFTKLREERTDKTMAILTAEQKDKLKSIQGSTFDVSQISSGFGRRGKN